MKQLGLFGLPKRLKDLSENGDPLEKLSQIVNFELFRDELEKGLNFSEGLKGGRPPTTPFLFLRSWFSRLYTIYPMISLNIKFKTA
jgi:hypothetical protein